MGNTRTDRSGANFAAGGCAGGLLKTCPSYRDIRRYVFYRPSRPVFKDYQFLALDI